MERGFEVKTGSIPIGDPTMGPVKYDLGLPPVWCSSEIEVGA
jgi:hypothetical protein